MTGHCRGAGAAGSARRRGHVQGSLKRAPVGSPLVGRIWRGLAIGGLLGLAAGALSACDDGRAFNEPAQRGQASKLIVPETMTPPVLVTPVAGAPASWKLHTRVAEALRQRDVPAGLAMRGRNVYRLEGKVMQIARRGAKTQVTVKWRLLDPNGKQVGEVTQMAAVPTSVTAGDTGKPPAVNAANADGDVTDAMAEAAAESISPIVPSNRLRTSQQAMTGLPTPRTRRQVEAANPVTAIGKAAKARQTRLGQHLLKPRTNDKGAKAAGGTGATVTGATAQPDAKTALGRRGGGKSALSRNLMRDKRLTVPNRKAGGAVRLPAPVRSGAGRGDGARAGRAGERMSGTTSGRVRERAAARRQASAGSGSMEALFRDYPTRTEREDGVAARRTPAAPAARAPNIRHGAARYGSHRKTARSAVRSRVRRANAMRTGVRKPAAKRAASRSLAERRPPATSKFRPKPRTSPKLRTSAKPMTSPKPRSNAASKAAAARRVYWVQIGSYRSRALAELKWRAARRAGGRELAAANRRIMRARIERRGVFYRVQIGPYVQRDNASGMCRRLKSRNLDCFLYRETEQAGLPVNLPVTRAGGPAVVVQTPIAPAPPRSEKKTAKPEPKTKGRKVISRLSNADSPDPRPDKAPISTSPGLPGLPK